MNEHLLTEIDDGVALLTLNRPESLNALSAALMEDLRDALTRIAADPSVGCVVLTGAGRGFCAGGDVRVQAAAASGTPASPEERAHSLRGWMDSSRLLHMMPKPTIAMVNGVAAGAGMCLALACDMRIAGASARMTTAFAKVGFSGDFGGIWFLTRLVGTALARELYFTTEVLDIARIEALGLANRVVADAALRGETMALARSLAAGPRVAWRYMKRNMALAETAGLPDLLDAEAFGMLRCRETEDHKEAARAFVEKRAPMFRGR